MARAINYPREVYGTRIYQAWSNMKRRCDDSKTNGYHRYGGRGISYDPRWKEFVNFYNDMKDTFSEDLELDRIDNNGNYIKDNCRWISRKEQCNNRKTSKWITYNGETKTLAQWGECLGIKGSTLRQRFYCYKWDIDKCFNYSNINIRKD